MTRNNKGAPVGTTAAAPHTACFDAPPALPVADVSATFLAADAGPVSATTAAVSAPTLALATMSDTVAMERTLNRLPLHSASRQAGAQPTLWDDGSLYGYPIRIDQAHGVMDDHVHRVLAHLIRRYAETGCPPDRRVSFTLAEAARWAGYDKGGRQFRLVKDGLLRMRSTTLESAVRYPDGRTGWLAWGLIDRAWTTDAVRASGGFVTLSEEMAGLIRVGSLTYLDAPTLDALGELDGMAVILWSFLEGESRTPWRHSLFSAPEGSPPVNSRETPAIADLLRVSGWAQRRRAKQRIATACAAIMAVDPRYRLVIGPGRGRGMWTLNVARAPGAPGRPRGVLPGALGCTPRYARVYPQVRGRAQNGGVPSVLPSVLPEILPRVSAREENRATARNRDAILEAERQGRPDVAALLERTGWQELTPKVAELLGDLADRHDLTGPAWAAERIREAPITTGRPGDDVIGYLLEADAAWHASRLEADEARDRADRERRDPPPAEAAAVIARLAARWAELRVKQGGPILLDDHPGVPRETPRNLSPSRAHSEVPRCTPAERAATLCR